MGAGFTTAGAVFTVLGLIGFASARDGETRRTYDDVSGTWVQKPVESDKTASNFGWAMTGIGLVSAVIGVVLLLSNTNDVQVNEKTIASKKSPRFGGVRLTSCGFVF